MSASHADETHPVPSVCVCVSLCLIIDWFSVSACAGPRSRGSDNDNTNNDNNDNTNSACILGELGRITDKKRYMAISGINLPYASTNRVVFTCRRSGSFTGVAS